MISPITNEVVSRAQRNSPAGRRRSQAATVDRLPPHAADMEQGVLGCVLLAPQECLAECVTKFKGNPVFYDLRHQTIYDGLVAMWDAQVPVDVITVQQWLKDRQLLEQVGGIAYLSSLPDAVPSAANLAYYVEIVFEKFLLRRAIQVCGECIASVYDFEGEVDELLDRVEADILKVGEARLTTVLGTMTQLAGQAIDLVEKMHRGVGIIGGIQTHFGYFDKMAGGLWRGETFVLAGRPSLGKTSLAMNIARNVALIQKRAVGVFSLEMTALQLVLRLWCTEAEADFSKIRTGFISHEAMQSLANCITKVSHLPIYIDDTAGISILELRARARRMVHQFKVELIVVDYLQLLSSTSNKAHNREQEIADISKGLKGMAKELNVPVIVLSQLNREAEKRKYAKPQLSDLRESGAIEQDADIVGILYRPKQENEEDEDGPVVNTNLHIVKQRNGPTGDVEFIFKRFCMRFEDAYGNTGHAAAPAGAGLSRISKIDPQVEAEMFSKQTKPTT